MIVFFSTTERQSTAPRLLSLSRSLPSSLARFLVRISSAHRGIPHPTHAPTKDHHVQPRRRRPLRPEEGLPARARRRRVAPQARDQHRRAAQGQARRVADEEARRHQRRGDGRGLRRGVERPRWRPGRGGRGRGLPGHWRLRRRRHDGGLDAARRRRKRQGESNGWKKKRDRERETGTAFLHRASVLLSAPLSPFAAKNPARRACVRGNKEKRTKRARKSEQTSIQPASGARSKKKHHRRSAPFFPLSLTLLFSFLSINTHEKPFRPSPSSQRWSRASGPRTWRCSSRPPRSSGSCCRSVRTVFFFFFG